ELQPGDHRTGRSYARGPATPRRHSCAYLVNVVARRIQRDSRPAREIGTAPSLIGPYAFLVSRLRQLGYAPGSPEARKIAIANQAISAREWCERRVGRYPAPYAVTVIAAWAAEPTSRPKGPACTVFFRGLRVGRTNQPI